MGNSVTTIAMIALMVVAFYFLILRPQKKRQQAQQKTMNELVPGTRVLLGSGVFGTLVWVGAKQAVMEISPGVELTVLKQAIARVVNEGDEYSEPLESDDEDEDELEQLEDTDENGVVHEQDRTESVSGSVSDAYSEPSTLDLEPRTEAGRTSSETTTTKD